MSFTIAEILARFKNVVAEIENAESQSIELQDEDTQDRIFIEMRRGLNSRRDELKMRQITTFSKVLYRNFDLTKLTKFITNTITNDEQASLERDVQRNWDKNGRTLEAEYSDIEPLMAEGTDLETEDHQDLRSAEPVVSRNGDEAQTGDVDHLEQSHVGEVKRQKPNTKEPDSGETEQEGDFVKVGYEEDDKEAQFRQASEFEQLEANRVIDELDQAFVPTWSKWED